VPLFRVTAYDTGGNKRVMRRDASGEDELLKALALEGFVPTEVVADKSAGAAAGRSRRLSLADQHMYCAMLGAFLQSGLSLTEVLGLMGKQTKDKALKGAYSSLRESVESGRSLAQSMRASGAFRESLVGMVEAGEKSSALPEVLDKAAALTQSEISVRRRVQAALTYPALMLIVGSLVTAFLVAYVVPQMTEIIIQSGQALPLSTRMLIAVSKAVKYGGAPFATAILIAYLYIKKSGKKIKLPFFTETRNLLSLSLIFSQMSTLLKSGVALVQALEMTESMDPVKGRMRFLAEEVRKGYRFSQSLEREGSYPEDVVAIVRIGEAGGNLPGCLDRIAANSWDFAQASMQKWSSLAEPMIIIVMGAVIGFVVLAVLLPIFNMADLAQLR
jgi:type II secretory pathway component PulF